MFKRKKKLVTHSGSFHSDDIFACATIQLYLDNKKEKYQVIRTRDEKEIEKGDYVFDIGGIYDTNTNRFDHHQRGGAGERENGIKYAAFGLVWNNFGEEICGSQKIKEDIDRKIVQGIDAPDNGQEIFKTVKDDVFPVTFQSIVSASRPVQEGSDKRYLEEFLKLVYFAKDYLKNTIKAFQYQEKIDKRFKEIYDEQERKEIIVFSEKDVVSRDNVVYSANEYSDVLYIIYKSQRDDTWNLVCARDELSSFSNRKDLPREWGGKTKEELRSITGVSGANFCHNGLFLAGANSKEDTTRLAEIALNS